MQVDRHRRLRPEAFGEVVALQHALHGDLTGQAQDVEERKFAEPVAVAVDLGLADVDDLADLGQVIARIVLDLFGGQPGPRLVPTAGVADQGSVIAEDQHRLMAQFLEQLQFAQGNGVAEMDVDPGGVDAVLDAQGLAGLDAPGQFADQFVARLDLLDSAFDQDQLFGNACHRLLPFSAGLPPSEALRSRSGRVPRRRRPGGNGRSEVVSVWPAS